MVSRLWLFGLILGIPVIGLFASEGIQAYLNDQLRSAARADVPELDQETLSRLTLDGICKSARSGLEEICADNRNLELMRAGAIASGGVGLALILAMRLAGTAARSNRRLLLTLFKPGFYLTALILVGLVCLNAAVSMTALYYGELVLLERVHPIIILAVGAGAFLGITAMVSNLFSLVRKAEIQVTGKAVSREEAPALWQKVEEIARRLGALQPDHVIVGLDPNFFVTEADVVGLDGKRSGRTLYCSLPLCRVLSADEFSSIIGHELGHYQGQDTEYSLKFFPIYRGTLSSIESLRKAGSGTFRAMTLRPAIAVLSYFLECFAGAERRISRERELSADQTGVSVTDARTFAAALVKVHAFSGVWDRVVEAAIGVMKEGRMLVNASKTYAGAAREHSSVRALQGLAEKRLTHPTDSHPPLFQRMEALGLSLEEVAAAALDVQPVQPAVELLSNIEPLEERLSDAYQEQLARDPAGDPDADRSAGEEKATEG